MTDRLCTACEDQLQERSDINAYFCANEECPNHLHLLEDGQDLSS